MGERINGLYRKAKDMYEIAKMKKIFVMHKEGEEVKTAIT
jgi:hypothetical protein